MPPETGTGHSSRTAVYRPAYRSAWALLVALALAWYLPFSLTAGHVGYTADDALYLMTADWMRFGWHDDPVLLYLRSVNHLPPFYSLLLALTGGGSEQVDIAHLVQSVCLVAAMVAHGALARRLLGDTASALLLAATLLILPASLVLATEIWSEFLYLLLVALSLISALRARQRPSWWLAAALCAGLAGVTRGFGIVAVIVVLMAAGWQARRWAALCALPALLPLVAVEWFAVGGGSEYVDVFLARVHSPDQFLAFVSDNLRAIDAGLWQAVAAQRPPGGAWVYVLLAPPLLLTLWRRLRTVEADALYVVGYFLLLAMWPFPAVMDRLVYPLLPLLLIYLVAALSPVRLAAHVRLVAVLLVLVGVSLQSVPLAARYFAPGLPAEHAAWRASRYWLLASDDRVARDHVARLASLTELLERVPAHVPIQQCINSDHPQAVMFHARRIAWPAPAAGETGRATCRYRLVTAPLDGGDEVPLQPRARVIDRALAGDRVIGLLVRYDR